ncbi:MAG: dihydrolipoyllysine-residue succinyltransferase [Acidobacteria bacterium]|uniref:Dihydrolipoyllysine-residue succinyltransferase component of 2-oxoglutarate dehydrogenase complex n=1 Tax=Candidatus Polarisedimenticola svalbardensis TaxID=2886004 RepID=A0A8J7CLS9_9BACT|nr:dihydrolipoyllysine-residue succinyltransferase [Candidatus Polarisedimenticola svalbardensis]
MRIDVPMPQMGESIAEGTITRWIKKVGETVKRDEPLFEISTDKVDAEIPAPAAGTLVEIKNQEGETVPVNEIVAILETDATAAAKAPAAPAAKPEPAKAPEAPKPVVADPAPATAAAPAAPGVFVSPVVRNIAAEHGIDPTRVPGTGSGGRVTKKDILAFIAQGGATAPTTTPVTMPAATASQPGAPVFASGERDLREAMTPMRRKIAEHMIDSQRTSAHVQSVFEVDMSRIVSLRSKMKQAYLDRHDTKLTMTPFFIKAVCDALRAWPIINSSVDGDTIVYHKELNIGIAVALDWGLIVPVVRNADELSMAGLSKQVNDLAERARTKKLNPDEVQNGTFTITNPGIFGGLYGLPIINQPQVAILGIGGIEKRPVVINDAIAIRPMVYISMSYDHRVVDGAVADQYLARLKNFLENFDESLL